MSQAKLTLRPPPNVEFVHGYPGIPPAGPDRPQASVKGALEVRVGPQAVKAKWVRIELRKVETLPGGGPSNTFYDFVGQSPMTLWQAPEDYAPLQTQDFPFQIRIPESIPPTLALEKNAGVRYELIATACLKGKKGFFRRNKSVILSTSAAIIIDKHELHSTWPIYCQPTSRQVSLEGVSLTVNWSHRCYGPGDRVTVQATVMSDSLHTIILRGFEFTLRETTVYRSGHTTGKKAAPQVRISTVGDQKVPVNQTLYGGTMHKADLACTIPQTHTSATLNSARHIDIAYVMNVKALMGTGKPLVIDLPIIVSNWPRAVSVEAIKRIGAVSSLSNVPGQVASSVQMVRTPGQPSEAWTLPERSPQPAAQSQSFRSIQDKRAVPNGNGVDEFGYARPGTAGSAMNQSVHSVGAPRTSNERPGNEAKNNGRPGTANSAVSRAQWLTAEAEKQRLYEAAKARVDHVQGEAARARSPSPVPQPSHVDAGPLLTSASPSPPAPAPAPLPTAAWVTAEEEKMRLYDQATRNVWRTQGVESYSPPSTAEASSMHGRRPSVASTRSQPPIPMSPGAVLYSQAMAAVNRNVPSSSGAGGSSSIMQPQTPPPMHQPKPQYPNADQEKEMLRRYQEAKAAVERNQSIGEVPPEMVGTPVPYEALYPNQAGGSSSSPAPSARMNGSAPPSRFEFSPQVPVSEKERLRRHFEEQDRLAQATYALQQQREYAGSSSGSASGPAYPPASYSPPPVAYSPPPPAAYSPPTSAMPEPHSFQNAMSEKEMLRRRYEEQDAAAMSSSPPRPPPRSGSSGFINGPRSPPPAPPDYSNMPSRPLTAAEEKAMLRAQYEAEDRQAESSQTHASGSTSSGAGTSSSIPLYVPPPPPLAPRPPVEYIQETQEEDYRSRSVSIPNGVNGSRPEPASNHLGVNIRPFSPFQLGIHTSDFVSASPSSPPPLPPKVPL